MDFRRNRRCRSCMTTTFMTSGGFARGALGFGPGLGCPVFDLPVGERGQGGEHFAQVAVGIEPAEEEEGTREAGGRAGRRRQLSTML